MNPAATPLKLGFIPAQRDMLLRHFPHHVALAPGHVAEVLREAFGCYLDVTLKS